MDFQPVFEQPYSSSSITARFLTNENLKHSIVEELRQQRFKYILLRTDLTVQWLQQLSDQDRQRLAPLVTSADQPLWSGNGFVVLSVEQLDK